MALHKYPGMHYPQAQVPDREVVIDDGCSICNDSVRTPSGSSPSAPSSLPLLRSPFLMKLSCNYYKKARKKEEVCSSTRERERHPKKADERGGSKKEKEGKKKVRRRKIQRRPN